MPRLRVLSGAEVVAILAQFGFALVSQRGSHLKLRRLSSGKAQTLTVPSHREVDRGTLQAIFRQACRFVPEADLRGHFYTE